MVTACCHLVLISRKGNYGWFFVTLDRETRYAPPTDVVENDLNRKLVWSFLFDRRRSVTAERLKVEDEHRQGLVFAFTGDM